MGQAGLPSEKPEYPPLLPVGFHEHSLADLRKLCVERFAKSETRARLADGFESVVEQVRNSGLACEFWVNGSFLTEKIDPNDVDFIVRIASDDIENASEEQAAAIELLNGDLSSKGCHSFIHIDYPKEHALHAHGVWMQAYWLKQWGFARDEGTMKGIAVLKMAGASK